MTESREEDQPLLVGWKDMNEKEQGSVSRERKKVQEVLQLRAACWRWSFIGLSGVDYIPNVG